MTGLISNARLWWDGRTVREQRMLMVMGVCVAAFLLWFAVIAPLWGWKAAAAERKMQAATDLATVQAGLARLDGPSDTAAQPAADVARKAEQVAAGLSTPVVVSVGEGGADFVADRISGAALFGWLAALERDQGVVTTSLSVVENSDATLQAQGTLTGG